MSSSAKRDLVNNLARSDPREALEVAREIYDPWYRAQAYSWIARFTDGSPLDAVSHAASAANACKDKYQKTGVRAWEIAALAERGYLTEARDALETALEYSREIPQLSSRAEALMLLLAAAYRIGNDMLVKVVQELRDSCGEDSHWRCKRAIKEASKIVSNELKPRKFFW